MGETELQDQNGSKNWFQLVACCGGYRQLTEVVLNFYPVQVTYQIFIN